ncbi:Trans-enoyl reductase fsdC [Colletotrichum trifolii]|uniref:Trans-enoyl reductase fsdC n=1 Tax=Colletotrichum trifolii TaxID=5466 RepID=A0A4R8RN60_COLTR|nr:Trans-enoyl reductase fsdC [Colletotrichum trifolii]
MTKSIYLGADGSLSIAHVTEEYNPQSSQALVAVKYSGVNLCDLNFFYVGLNSYITGFEFAGVVEATGPDSSFKVGDAVLGLSPISLPKPSSVGTHQDKAIVEENLTFKIPDGLDIKHAAGLAMSAHTAADAVFNTLGVGLPAAGVTGIDATGLPILIWGGASSVGTAAIQFAKAAGFTAILVTASPKNHATLKSLGATHCFDYRDAGVTNNIRETVESLGIKLTTAFDAVGNGLSDPGVDADKTSPSLARKSLSDGVDSTSLKLACTLPVPHDSAFGFCTSYRPAGSVGAFGHPQDPEFPVRTRKAVAYFFSTVDKVPMHPNITVVKGGYDGIDAIRKVATGAVSLQKVVIEHPI